MNKNYRALELDKILDIVASETTCDDAAEAVRAIEPVKNASEARLLLEETDAAFVLMAKFGGPSFRDLKNVSNPLRRAQAGGSLGMRELLDVAGTLRSIRSLQSWHDKSAGMRTALSDRFSVLAPNKYLEEKIFTCIISEEEMADAASPALAIIRRKIRNASARARDQLDKLVRSPGRQVRGAGKGRVQGRGAGACARHVIKRGHGVHRAHERC